MTPVLARYDYARISGYPPLNGEFVRIAKVDIDNAGEKIAWVNFITGGSGIMLLDEMTKINNPELWFGGK